MTRKATTLASMAVLALHFLASPVSANDQTNFTSGDILSWRPDNRVYYLKISVIMAAAITAQNDKAKSKCISQWNQQHEGGGYSPIIEAMRQNPRFHPQAITIAVLQKACGSLKFTN